jgi:transposase
MKRTQCDTIKTDERRRKVVISLSLELAEESDPSRTDAPEIVAPARAGITLRRIYSIRADSRLSRPERVVNMIRKIFDVIHNCVAGLDVHRDSVMACRRRLLEGGEVESEVKQFGTTTAQLQLLAQWLSQWGVTDVAMESTGVYWIAVWNILDGQFQLLLANAQRLRKVPGRKSDVGDAEWIAQLMQCGLLKASFVPNREIRNWRDLTRQRTKLTDHHTSVVNRLHRVLQQGNIKLSSVASDVMGVSGRLMMQALIEGEKDADKLASLAKGRLKAKREQLREAMEGSLSEDQLWLMRELLNQASSLEKEIEVYDAQIKEKMSGYGELISGLDTIDGVDRRGAEAILAELGPDMRQFGSEKEIVSWAGLCPGKNESAGKQRSSRTPKGNRWLRRVLVECAWSVTREKDSYMAAMYRRLLPRRGKKRAIVAVARTMLVAAWHILKEGVEYKELGGEYFDRINEEKTKRNLIKRLERLGYEVELKPKKDAA